VDREMKKNNFVSDKHAVSEVIGGLILIAISVVIFSSIYVYVFPLPLPAPDAHIKLMGYVDDDGNAVIEHMGGESLSTYKIDVKNVSGALINSAIYQGDPWRIGKCVFPAIENPLSGEDDMVQIIIYNLDNEDEQQVFNGILKGKTCEATSGDYPMLISSLRTNTTEEDLICYKYDIGPDDDAVTYIYKWLVNGNSLAEILMPFDTENISTAKDYSDNRNDGSIHDAVWTDNGTVGGAYYFGGSSEYISLDLPSVFNDISINDFTICLWIKSDDITDDWRIVLMASFDNKNFVKLFQYGTEIHCGLCEDGVKRAVRTENLSSNTWYHIACVWDASEKSLSIYMNGNISSEIGNRNYAMGVGVGLLELGHGSSSSRFWLGYMDEFEVYDRVLSADQIYQNYISTKDGNSNERVVVSGETILGTVWQCIVIPNDGTQDGSSIESNILNIVAYGGD
jgi:hypothetical protein